MAKFIVDYRFSGRGTDTFEAESLADAQERVDANLNNERFEPPVDDFDDVYATVKEMHPVTRAGREIWTTLVLQGDTRGHASALKETPLFAEVK